MKKMSEHFDIEEEYHFFAQPYLFEPEYTDEELRQMDEAAAAQTDPHAAAADHKARATGTWWCHCTKCKPMPTEEENLCCNDWDLLTPPLENRDASTDKSAAAPKPCITDDPDFPPLLTRGVLEMMFHLPKINWKKRPTPAGPGGTLSVDQCRLMAYQVVLEWVLKGQRLSRDKRVLPSCVVAAIRDHYPSPTGVYLRLHESDQAFELI